MRGERQLPLAGGVQLLVTDEDVLDLSERVGRVGTELAAQIGGIANLVGMRARFSDLTVLGRPYGADAPGEAEAVVEAALWPVVSVALLLPQRRAPDPDDNRPL